ncbi:DUF393 domain-containing protein [Paracoccus liaowanqingii]|uniref:DUF393 domain-containing protein n=1 Tax=Paracoccus liaowanqingii TaxID=2560053 RepID=A0A4Z1BH84_9RHOB|nr:DCC1-like thiol-disulfide oxidoreductase family protein [Paracoccus liaowanqingii]TGN45260.1 DUF393 domain-containing protein [Paracoccus liaowanqingii]
MDRQALEIFYDGECPVCVAWMRMARLRDASGGVELIDARESDPRVAELMDAGFDLNQGMVVRWQDRIYHGAEAMTLLTLLSEAGGVSMRLQRALFGRPAIARRIYPLLVWGRLRLLRLMGRRMISVSKKESPAKRE